MAPSGNFGYTRIFGAHICTSPIKNIGYGPSATGLEQHLTISTSPKTTGQNNVKSLSNLKRPVEHVPNDSSHKEINVLNRVMEDVFICISLSENFGDFINQTDWPDLNLNWLIDYCFYYFTAWLSGYMYLFFFFMKRKAIWVTKTPRVTIESRFWSDKRKMWSDSETRTHYASARGRGGTPLYKLYIGMRRPIRLGFFAPFWTENGHIFYPFWSGIGMVFEGTTRVFELIYREKWVRKKDEIGEFEKDLRNFFVCAWLRNDYAISA